MRKSLLVAAVAALILCAVAVRPSFESAPVEASDGSCNFPGRAASMGYRPSFRPAAFASKVGALDAATMYLMGAAHLPGYNDTLWRTSLEVCNFGGLTQAIELAFLVRGQGNLDPDSLGISLAPGLCSRYPDVVEDVFGLDQAAGALRLTTTGEGVVAMARTYNDTPDGTFGSGFEATPLGEAFTSGESAVLVHLTESATDDSGFRTNLDLLNVTDQEITVEIGLYPFTGTLYGTLTATLQPFEYDQVFRVFREVTEGEVWDGYAIVETTTVDGAFMTGASLIDNQTGDTTAIAALAPPPAARWQEAQNIGEVVNSAANDWFPTLARDGSFMIFVSERPGGYGACDLYISRRVGGEWQPPENLGPNVNTSGMDSAPYLSADDSTLYFTSDSGANDAEHLDLFYCSLEDGVAGERVSMGDELNTDYMDCCPVISPDGNTLYICSTRPGGQGGVDVWMSQRVNGTWQEPTNLGSTVNSSATDSPRWLADDGASLVILSTRSGGYGASDLWYLVKAGNEWSRPYNFGSSINSTAYELGPGFLDNDGAIGGRIFFGSGRPGGFGGWDIWYSDFGYGAGAGRGAHRGLVTALSDTLRRADAGAAAQPAAAKSSKPAPPATCCGGKGQ